MAFDKAREALGGGFNGLPRHSTLEPVFKTRLYRISYIGGCVVVVGYFDIVVGVEE